MVSTAEERVPGEAGSKRNLWLAAAQAALGVALLLFDVLYGITILLLALMLTAEGARGAFVSPQRTRLRVALRALAVLAFVGGAGIVVSRFFS